ncbi:hypothetical protein U1Q18_045402, partial [Sarracenia purpurea var. burkii]
EDLNVNISLQSAIEDCLLETAKGIADARPLFDMMAITLEKLPAVKVVVRATIGSLIILAHMVSLASISTLSQQVFPEVLLVQLLKTMLYPDVEVRAAAHQIFSVLLIPSSNPHHDVCKNRRRWHSDTASAFASITALLERLRREKDGTKVQKHGISVQDDFKEREVAEEDRKPGRALKNSPNFHKISSIFDRTTGSTSLAVAEPSIMKFSEDQISQLLSAFWVQANFPDNLPSNVEAIAHSYCLTLISLRLKLAEDMICFLLLIGVDPYVSISGDFQIYVKPRADVREYGSVADNQEATSLLHHLRNKIGETDKILVDSLVQSLSSITELEADEVVKQLSEPFTPDDAFMFGPHSVLDFEGIQGIANSKETLSCDGDFPTNSMAEDDVTSKSSVADLSCFIPKMPASPSMSHIISIGQLLESALEVAGQVAGTSISTSPLPYSAMASQCEALGIGARKKLSSWLTHEIHCTKTAENLFPALPVGGGHAEINKVHNGGGAVAVHQGALPPPPSMDPWLALRLPPASPFDNFLRAARC